MLSLIFNGSGLNMIFGVPNIPDYIIKLFKYRTSGVRESWEVDAEKELVTVYDFVHDDMEEYSFGADVPVGIYEGCSIKVQ